MVKMDLGFAPTRMAMLRENLKQAFVILLGRVKVGMHKCTPLRVSPSVHDSRIFVSPTLQPSFLFEARNALLAACGID
jgi:hypothetical protein